MPTFLSFMVAVMLSIVAQPFFLCAVTQPAAYRTGMQLLHAICPAAEGDDDLLVCQLTGHNDARARAIVAAIALYVVHRYGSAQWMHRLRVCAKRVPGPRSSWRTRTIMIIVLLLLFALLLRFAWPAVPDMPAPCLSSSVPQHHADTIVSRTSSVSTYTPALLAPSQPVVVRGKHDIFPDNGPDPVDCQQWGDFGWLGTIRQAGSWLWQQRELASALLDAGYKMSMIYGILRPAHHATPSPVTDQPQPPLPHSSPPTAVPPITRSIECRMPKEPLLLLSDEKEPSEHRALLLRAGLYVLGGVAIAGALRWYQHKYYTATNGALNNNRSQMQQAVAELSCSSTQREQIAHACQRVEQAPPEHREKEVAQAYILGLHHARNDSPAKRNAIKKYAEVCLNALPNRKNKSTPFSFSENLVY